MWRDAISVWHLQTYCVIPGRSSWVTFKNCELCARGHKCRRRTVWNCIGCECVFLQNQFALQW